MRARFASGGNKERWRESYVCNGQNLHFSKLVVLRERPLANRGGLRPADCNGSGRGTPHSVGAGSGVVLPSLLVNSGDGTRSVQRRAGSLTPALLLTRCYPPRARAHEGKVQSPSGLRRIAPPEPIDRAP